MLGDRQWWWRKRSSLWNLDGRSFQRLIAVMDMTRLDNFRRVMTGVEKDQDRIKTDRVERVGWMVKSSPKSVGWAGSRRIPQGAVG